MLERRLNLAAPSRREAIQLSLVLWTAVVCVIAPAVLIAGQVTSVGEFLSLITGAITALLFATLLYGLTHIVSGRPLWFAIPMGLVGLSVTAILQMIGDYAGQYLLHAIFAEHRMPDTSPQAVALTTVIYWALSACNIVLFWISATSRRLRDSEAELAHAQISALQAQINMLRMQLNPHFMCNSLNTVSSLILEGRHAEANRMAEQLADFLRGVMDVEGDEVRLRNELATIESYIDVEAMRFGSRLHVTVDAADEVRDAAVPNFILQPLVENALKYGVEAVTGPVSLRLSARRDARDLMLVVENRAEQPGAVATGRGVVTAGHGIGLSNTRARLHMLFGDRGVLETREQEGGFRATIRIPFNALAPAQDPGAAAREDLAMQR